MMCDRIKKITHFFIHKVPIFNYLCFKATIPNEDVSYSFGLKHSPYLYHGSEMRGERSLSTKTERLNGNVGEFRQRSGTFTREDKPFRA